MGVGEAEEPFEHDVDFRGEPGQQLRAFVGRARIGAVGRGAKREHHHQRRNNQHARNDGQANINTRATTVEQRVQDAHEHRLRLILVFVFRHERVLSVVRMVCRGLRGVVRIGFQHEILHEACRDNTAHKCAEESDERLLEIALSDHENNDDESHSEGRSEVRERNELVFLEIAGEMLVFRERDDGGVVREERQHGTQRGHARQVEQRFHQRTQQLLEQINHAKFHENLADGTREHADGHQVEAGVEQQVVGRVHHGVEHRRCAHFPAQKREQANHDGDADNASPIVSHSHES